MMNAVPSNAKASANQGAKEAPAQAEAETPFQPPPPAQLGPAPEPPVRAVFTSTFESRYQRNNKRTGRKNLRCFPQCTVERHVLSGFCGRPVQAVLTALPAPYLTVSSPAAAAAGVAAGTGPFLNHSNTVAWARFEVFDGARAFQEGQVIGEEIMEAETRCRKDPTAQWIRCEVEPDISLTPPEQQAGVQSDATSAASANTMAIALNTPAGTAADADAEAKNGSRQPRLLVTVNGERMGYHYAWVSNKHTCDMLHCLRIYIFERKLPSASEAAAAAAAAATASAIGDGSAIAVPTGSRVMLRMLGVATSPHFQIYCRRRQRGADKEKQTLRAEAARSALERRGVSTTAGSNNSTSGEQVPLNTLALAAASTTRMSTSTEATTTLSDSMPTKKRRVELMGKRAIVSSLVLRFCIGSELVSNPFPRSSSKSQDNAKDDERSGGADGAAATADNDDDFGDDDDGIGVGGSPDLDQRATLILRQVCALLTGLRLGAWTDHTTLPAGVKPMAEALSPSSETVVRAVALAFQEMASTASVDDAARTLVGTGRRLCAAHAQGKPSVWSQLRGSAAQYLAASEAQRDAFAQAAAVLVKNETAIVRSVANDTVLPSGVWLLSGGDDAAFKSAQIEAALEASAIASSEAAIGALVPLVRKVVNASTLIVHILPSQLVLGASSLPTSSGPLGFHLLGRRSEGIEHQSEIASFIQSSPVGSVRQVGWVDLGPTSVTAIQTVQGMKGTISVRWVWNLEKTPPNSTLDASKSSDTIHLSITIETSSDSQTENVCTVNTVYTRTCDLRDMIEFGDCAALGLNLHGVQV